MKRSRQAFTLIELILGLSLLTVVMLTIYSVFWGGIRLGYKAESAQDIYRQAYWSLDIMTRELENMVRYSFKESYPEKSCFIGAKDKITFISPTPDGLKIIRYYLLAEDYGTVHKTIVNYNSYKKNVRVSERDHTAEATKILVRQEMDFARYVNEDGAEDKLTDDDDLEVIAVRVKADGLRFSYGSMESSEEGGAGAYTWLEEWGSTELPLGVKIELDLVAPEESEQVVHFTKEALIPTEVWSRVQ
ncbi:MAG: prepilin-type N-terminal cleavage/methylation domain-containing protein [Candidatus Omnitrophica bacterium]|nr:prepilin-type N-terminal cleavage/methylation domain-containing protein [Candidatus Omnitrophota bacterium]